MTIENLWKVNATITVFLALVTGAGFASGMYVQAMFAAFSTGFALATTIVSVALDIEVVRAVPLRGNTNEYLGKRD